MYYWDAAAPARFKLKRDLSKTKNCPTKLISMFKKYDDAVKDYEALDKERKQGGANRDKLPYKEATEIIRELRNKLWAKKKSLRNQAKNIIEYPIVPLIIPKKKLV